MGAKTAKDEEGETDEISGGKIETKTRTPDRRYFSAKNPFVVPPTYGSTSWLMHTLALLVMNIVGHDRF